MTAQTHLLLPMRAGKVVGVVADAVLIAHDDGPGYALLLLDTRDDEGRSLGKGLNVSLFKRAGLLRAVTSPRDLNIFEFLGSSWES